MLTTCDPQVVRANQGRATTVGVEHIRAKFEPRIASSNFQLHFELQHIQIYGDLAMAICRFGGTVTNKVTGEVRENKGRAGLNFRRDQDGDWKMTMDMDNQDDTN